MNDILYVVLEDKTIIFIFIIIKTNTNTKLLVLLNKGTIMICNVWIQGYVLWLLQIVLF
jgi:hypothetical protein